MVHQLLYVIYTLGQQTRLIYIRALAEVLRFIHPVTVGALVIQYVLETRHIISHGAYPRRLSG